MKDSKLNKMIVLIQNAAAQKALQNYSSESLQEFIIPIVVGLAIAITFLPYFLRMSTFSRLVL